MRLIQHMLGSPAQLQAGLSRIQCICGSLQCPTMLAGMDLLPAVSQGTSLLHNPHPSEISLGVRPYDSHAQMGTKHSDEGSLQTLIKTADLVASAQAAMSAKAPLYENKLSTLYLAR